MVWGVTGGNGLVKEELLSPLGLTCLGGWKKDKIYHVTNNDKSFDVHLDEKEITNIKKIYGDWLRTSRKKKLEQIENR